MPPKNSSRSSANILFQRIQWISCASGVAASLYLFAQHTRLKSGIQESASFCTLGKYADCDVVNASRYSEIAGVPLAAIGALFYFVCLCLSVIGPRSDRNFSKAQQLLGWLSFASLGADLAMLLLQLFVLQTICLVCTFTYLCSAGIFVSSLRLFEPAGGNRLKALFSRRVPSLKLTRPALASMAVALTAFVTLLLLLPSQYRLRGESYELMQSALQQFYGGWKNLPAKKIAVDSTDAVFGNPDAKIQFVEFSDFQCPHCRRAAFTLHTALKPLKNRVRLTFKHFPLDSSCNPAMQYQMHPHACSLARLAICANTKGKFWEFHDTIFMRLSEEEVASGITDLTPKLTAIFSKEEIDACLKDPKSLAQVKQDIQVGTATAIAGTPAVYLNGKHVSIPLTVETINRLVELESAPAP